MALECRIGKAHIAVPTDWVSRIVEVRTSPLPLAKRWIGGIGVHEGSPILSIALVPPRPNPDAGLKKGILLHAPGSAIGWALEIHEVFIFVRVTVIAQGETPAAAQRLPRWIGAATTADGRSLAWLHVATMLADLTHVEERVS